MLQYIRDQILELVKESLLVRSSVMTHRSWSQPDDPQGRLNRIAENAGFSVLNGSGM